MPVNVANPGGIHASLADRATAGARTAIKLPDGVVDGSRVRPEQQP